MEKVFPLTGATAGGAIGGIGGPGTAAAGAAAGYAIGEVAATNVELGRAEQEVADAEKKTRQAMQTIDALTRGDAQALIKQQLEASEKSWGERALSEVWGIVKLVGFISALILFIALVGLPLLHKHGIKKAALKAEEHLKTLFDLDRLKKS
jgi:hypothetical protein